MLRNLMVILMSVIVLGGCDLIETSKELKKDSDHLGKRTDDMERELLNKESNTTLKDNLDLLFGEGKYGNQPISEPTLLLYAGFAVESMHFQYWKGDYNETLAVLDEFMTQSLEVMFVHTTRHIPRHFDVNVYLPDRDYKAVGSLAAKLDRLRPEYAQVLRHLGLPSLSAYDVIVNALRDRGQTKRTELLPKATAMVLQWKQEAIYLLQMRHNYLPLTVLGRMTNFQEQENVSWKIWDTRLSDIFFTQKVKLSDFDPEQMKEWSRWLQVAIDTRQELSDMCLAPQYNTTAFRILKVNFEGAATESQNGFVKLYQQVLSQKVNPAVTDCGAANR